jgi:2-keto-4-pentenoate hydratase/2-oxohepta-3-ene-1,7-dioic acid hydratase in catechol pathway
VRLRRHRLADGTGHTLAVQDPGSGAWTALAPESTFGGDMIAFLGTGTERTAAGDGDVEIDPTPVLPFAPRSLRASSLYEAHIVASSRTLVQRFFPPLQARAVRGFERVARRDFPKLKPPELFYEKPLFYVGNHTAFLADGEPLRYPSHTRWLDFELEVGFVLAGETPEIAGFVLVNDWSARDVQADEYQRGMFGPVVKSKSFANSMGATVVTADEVLPQLAGGLPAEVRVNGEVWARSSTAGAQHGPEAMVAYAGEGERLGAGDLFSMGTLPGCCGMELDRWVSPGDEVELEVELLGTLSTRIDE